MAYGQRDRTTRSAASAGQLYEYGSVGLMLQREAQARPSVQQPVAAQVAGQDRQPELMPAAHQTGDGALHVPHQPADAVPAGAL